MLGLAAFLGTSAAAPPDLPGQRFDATVVAGGTKMGVALGALARIEGPERVEGHQLLELGDSVRIVVTEHDCVIAFSDADEQESDCFLELPVVFPEVGDVIAELHLLVSHPEIYRASAVFRSALAHSNAFSPVTACPRINV